MPQRSPRDFGRIISEVAKSGMQGNAPLDATLSQQIVGNSDEFLSQLREFEQNYFNLISDRSNLTATAAREVDPDLMKRLGKIDLTVLNFKLQQEMKAQLAGVYQVEKLFANTGFPMFELPTSNPFRVPFRTEVDPNVDHAYQVVMSKTIFNIDPLEGQIANIGFNIQNVMSADEIERTLTQTKAMKAGNLIKDTDTIYTLDIESTGLMFGSQQRSISVTKRVGLQGPTESAFNFAYDSPRLAGLLAVDPNSGNKRNLSMTLSEFISSEEGFGKGNTTSNPQEYLENMKQVLRKITEDDVKLAGHNINYDIDMMLSTMRQMPGYDQDKELLGLVDTLIQKKKDPNYLIDTLHIGRNYMDTLVKGHLDSLNIDPADIGTKRAEYIRRYYSAESLADVVIGGKSTQVGVENFVLNTNLLDLMAREENASTIFESIFKGSHIAETDTVLQDYMLKYMHEGKLDFRGQGVTGPMKAGITEDVIDLARQQVFRSRAIVPTSNIADVRQLTQTAYNYLQTDEGLTGMTAAIDKSEAAKIGLKEDQFGQASRGYIKYSSEDKKFKLITGAGSDPLEQIEIQDTDLVRSYFRELIQSSQADDIPLPINMGAPAAGRLTTEYNPARMKILNLGINFQNNQSMEIMQQIISSNINIPQEVDVASYVKNVGNFYENFADNPRIMNTPSSSGVRRIFDQVSNLVNPQRKFSIGFNQQGRAANEVLSTYVSHGQTMLGAGIRTGALDITDAIMSESLSRATSGIATERYSELASMTDDKFIPGLGKNLTREQILGELSYASKKEISDVTSQVGLSHFRKQSALRFFDEQGEASKNVILNYDYFKELANRAGETIEGKSVSLSLVNRVGKEAEGISTKPYQMLNLMYKEDEGTKLTSKFMAEQLYEDFIASDNFVNFMDLTDQEIGETKAQIQAFVGRLEQGGVKGRDAVVEHLTETMKRSGPIIGYAGSPETADDISQFVETTKRLGVDLSRDDVTMRMSLLDDVTGHLRVGPVTNSARIVTQESKKFIKDMADTTISTVKRIGQELSSSPELLDEALTNVKVGTRKTPVSSAVEAYNKIKKPAGMAALGVAAAIGGYYLFNKKKESDLYDETLREQPIENRRKEDPFANNNAAYGSLASSRRDPLVTAGVVGNLDNNKIGHTRMGNRKYDHLYGG